MAHYIPPHARGNTSPDKLTPTPVLSDIFEPRDNLGNQNVTVRRSSVINGTGTGANAGDKSGSVIETSTNSALDSDTTAIDPQLLTVLKSIDSRLATQGPLWID